ncbi:signal peptidase I [Natronococcus occultus]|uniref:Signal peptidase I n=1 Tax=Natronococcus occultus SP4 TaxID=694430 RepID=L0K248_9EURY|nr:signal peptidase I [Natronococcus occultus]AGB38183.1 signal peptidase I [Natronococcus occultus SP4]
MRSVAARVTAGVVVLAVAVLVLGQLLGQPILLGYVATGSMEPTMDAGDGFVAVPSAVAGSPEEGDVVVFDAEELHGGELTTHRIVEDTPEGYVTAGDANPFTDQDGDEPPVSDDQIVAVAWQGHGEPVTIPHLGTAVMGVQGALESGYGAVASVVDAPAADSHSLGAALVGLGVALFGLGLLFDRLGAGRRETARSTSREDVYALWATVALVVVVLVALATAAMVVPTGTTAYEIAVTESPTDDPQVLEPGETTELSRTVENAGYAPVVVVHEAESDRFEADPARQTLAPRSDAETTLSVSAPAETGEYGYDVGEYRYLAVLPPAVLTTLHGIHPLVAVAAVDLVVVGLAIGLVVLLFGRGDLRIRSPGDHVPLSTRLRRRLRRWR